MPFTHNQGVVKNGYNGYVANGPWNDATFKLEFCFNKKQLHYYWNDHFIRVTALLGYLDLAGSILETIFRWTLTNV